jgi:hypothetical protein
MGADFVQGYAATVVSGTRSRFLNRFETGWRTFIGRASRLSRWSWPLTIAVALIYTACFASFIHRHTSLPFYDGYVYVQKTWNLADEFHKASFSQRLNPALYFKGAQPERPPLLIAIAAVLLGPNPGNDSIAYLWLMTRVLVILFSLYLLSREFRTSHFVPAAAMVIFGAPVMCNFYRLYFMDEPFGAFGLLAFTLILMDDRRETVGSAAAASASILALFLIKPVAPAFVLPFCAIRAVRALLPLRHHWPNLRPHVWRLAVWALPYFVLLAAMLVLIYASPYGPGIHRLYKLGWTGYWQRHISAGERFELVSFALPLWLLMTSFVIPLFYRRLECRVIALYGLAGLLWWLLFSFFLTFNVEDRLLGQALPYLAAAGLVWICQRPTMTTIVTAAAGYFFVCSTLVANGGMTPGSMPKTARFLSPIAYYQKPVPEVGLLPFAKQLSAMVKEKPRLVYGVFSEPYVEPNAVNMALRMTASLPVPFVRSVPKNPQDFDLARLCQKRWFITKTRRQNTGYVGTGLWTTMNCVHALITDPESPLHSYFHKVLESPIHQPDLEDTLVLWQLRSAPPNSAIAESLRWLKPRLTNDPPAFISAIDSQLTALAAP